MKDIRKEKLTEKLTEKIMFNKLCSPIKESTMRYIIVLFATIAIGLFITLTGVVIFTINNEHRERKSQYSLFIKQTNVDITYQEYLNLTPYQRVTIIQNSKHK